MPFQKNGKRDYKREHEWELKKARHRLKDRVQRVLARREMEKAGKVHKGDNKQVDHILPIIYGGSNSMSNLRAVSDKTNLRKEALRKQRASR
jgi:5-methylcytosine-specific restriction endonuclease McrA